MPERSFRNRPRPEIHPARDRRVRRRIGLRTAGVLLALCRPLVAGETRLDQVEHLTLEDGLAHTTVWDVHQDSRGFLWVATESVLQRYDGYDFRSYRNDPDDPDSISASQVWSISEDRQGNLWFGTHFGGLNRFDPATERFTRFEHDPDEPGSLGPGEVGAILEDRSGALWVGIRDGLDCLAPGASRFVHHRHDPDDPAGLSPGRVWEVLEDHEGDLWIATGGGLDRLVGSARDANAPCAAESFLHYREAEGLVHPWVTALDEDRGGTIWAGTFHEGLHRFDRARGTFEPVPLDSAGRQDSASLLAIREDRAGDLWATSFGGGLLRLEKTDAASPSYVPTRYRFDRDGRGPISDFVYDVHEDRTGVLWFATRGGISKLDPRRERFTVFRTKSEGPGGLRGEAVWAVTEDRAGVLWIGTLEGGLTGIDRGRGVTVELGADPGDPLGLGDDSVIALVEDRFGSLWIGTQSGGLAVLDPARDSMVRYRHDGDDPYSLATDFVPSLLEDRAGTIWLGGSAVVQRFEREPGRFITYRHDPDTPGSLPAGQLYDLFEDRSGDLWVATSGGLSRRDSDADRFIHVRTEPGGADLAGRQVLALHQDADGIYWLGTNGQGLLRWDRSRGGIEVYRQGRGLSEDKVVGILEDSSGRLWISTARGLTRFDPDTETFRTYDSDDGLHGNVFFYDNAFRSPSGEMFFGGPEGLTAFFPDRIEDDPRPPPVVLTGFDIADEPVAPRTSGAESPLERSITATRELVLNHRQKTFSFEFAALDFASPRKNRYAYRLEGYDRDWIDTAADHRRARYTNLDPGAYLFRVRAANPDGAWNDDGAALSITVRPPPWRTWWACSLYGVALAGMTAAYLRWQQRRVERERAVSARLRAVDRLKDEFLANTSHELRTPLYGITGLAESLLEGATGELPASTRANLRMIVASARRLSHLVNDILDFSKLRHKSLELDRRPIDLRPVADVVLTLSRPLVGSKELTLENSVGSDLPPVSADENRLLQILHNLVGNAVKFTEAGKIEVSAAVDVGRVTVRVADTGLGIPPAHQERIFEAFEQADASTEREFGGSGLGLAVTRQLVELHGGRIWVESAPGQGSSFFFTLPVAGAPSTRVAPAAALAPESGLDLPPSDLTPVEDAGRPASSTSPAARILVVDDEPVNRQVLYNYLAVDHYELTVASSGEEALRLLAEGTFDLVLLDVMMPKMSGYEVCRALRESHPLEELPVIFLTAKDRTPDLVAGMALGANDYLTKPITRSELLARIRPHLELVNTHRHLEDMVEQKISQIKVLRGLLPICASCKKIRDDEGYWSELEVFIDSHSEAQFSHGLCPDCARQMLATIGIEDEDLV